MDSGRIPYYHRRHAWYLGHLLIENRHGLIVDAMAASRRQ
jgi:hypothetical protein